MAHMEETLETNIVLKKNSIEAAGEVGDSTMCTEYEEGKMVSFVPECDSLQKCQDLGSAVSFAEDHEVSETSDRSVKADAICSLHLPMHPIDCKTNVHVDQQKVQEEGIDPLVPGVTRIVDSVAGTEHLEVDQMADELKSVVTHSFGLVFPELDALETLANTESTEYDTHKKHPEFDQMADELKSVVTHSFALVFPELDALETPANTESTEYDTHKKHSEADQMADELKSVVTHSFALVFPELDALETPANTESTEYDTHKKHPEFDQMADELKSAVTHSFELVFPELDALETQANTESTEYDTHKKQPEVDQMADELKSVVTHSFALVFPELDALETLAGTESTEYDTHKKHPEADQMADELKSVVTHSFALVFPELDALETPANTKSIECDTHKKHPEADQMTDELKSVVTHSFELVFPELDALETLANKESTEYDTHEKHLEMDQMADELKSVVTHSFELVFPELDALETPANTESTEYDTHKKHPKVDQMTDELKSVVTHSFELVFPELDALETLANKESTEYDTHEKHPEIDQMADELKSVVTHSFELVFPELDALKTLANTESIEYDTHKKHPEVDQMADKITSAATHNSLAIMLQELNTLETLTHKEGITYETCKKKKDVGKATSCAGNLELTEMNQSSVIADADSELYLPIHLIDNNSSVHIDQHTVQHTSIEPLHSTDILNSLAVENHPEKDNMFNEVESSEIHDSFASVLPEPDTLETLVLKDGADFTSCQNCLDNYGDTIATNDTHIVKVNGHKEFTVQNVDEAELVTNNETDSFTGQKTPGCDGCNLFSRVSNILLDSMSPGTEINNQDTIGPLENPAFLRTLHYSVSLQPNFIQPVTKDELPGPKSNLDLQSLAILHDPPDLDQGWAWVVLVAGFLANVLLGATIYASGVLMLTILQEIDSDLTKASWVGSVFVCAMCLSGPLVAVALKQFGTRATVFCAGIVLTAGFVGASFATSISELILTHGVIAGIGAGFVTNPVSVSVGQYFFRYRGLACGLLATGAGAGMLTGGTVISLLLDQYGLSGAYLIWGGMLFHTAVLGLLLRPSPEERLRALERDTAAAESYHGFINRSNAVSGFNSLLGSANHSMLSGIDKIGHTKRTVGPQNVSIDNSGCAETQLPKTDHRYDFQPIHAEEAETTNQILRTTPVTSSQHQKFGQDVTLGNHQHTSLKNSLTSMPSADNTHAISAFTKKTLINNAYILAASDPAYSNVTPNNLFFKSKSTHGLDKSILGRRFKGHSILSRVSCGDQEFPVNKFTFYSRRSVTPDQSHPRSYGANWSSQFSKSLGLGIRQYASLSASPYVTPKASSPPTITSCSQHMLTNDLHHSSSFCSAYIAATPNSIHSNGVLTSMPSSPASFQGPLAQSRIQRHRMSMTSLSQHASLSHCSVPLSCRGSMHYSRAGEIDSESITSALISQPRHRDIMMQKYPIGSNSVSAFMGSVGSIPTALAIVKDDVVRYETYSTAGIPEKGLKSTGIKILDSLRLLRQKSFLIFLSVCFLWSFGESPVMIYLPSYAVSRGTSQIQASTLYTAMGTGSIIGRFLSGLTASDSNIGPAILYSGCLGLAGLLIVLSPFITSTFMQQVVFSCLVGLYTGSLVPLSSLIAIDMLEIGKLGTGFGFISMAQGIGSLMGPPLASVFVTTYGYKNLFVFSGLALLAGSLLALIMSACIKDAEDMEFDEQVQKSKLENALKKITNIEIRPENGFHCEENVSKEVPESSRKLKLNGTPSEGIRDAADYHEQYSKEDKLGTIMEIAGK